MSNHTSIIARIRNFFGIAPAAPVRVSGLSDIVDAERGSHWDNLPFYPVGPAEERYAARIKSEYPTHTIAWDRSSIGGLRAQVLGVGTFMCSRQSAGIASDAQYLDR